MRRVILSVVLIPCLFVVPAVGSDRDGRPEFDDLKARVSQLERENRQMRARLEGLYEQVLRLVQAAPDAAVGRPDVPLAPPISAEMTKSPQAALTKPVGLDVTTASSSPSVASTPAGSTPVAAVAARDHVLWPDLLGGDDRVKLYGFLRVDLDMDSQRPNNGQTILFVTSPDLPQNDRGNFTIHPRLTRLGLDFRGPLVEGLGNASLSGRLETDFENGGSESRQIPRIRHAFFKLSWRHASLLGGQTWDAFSPLYPTVNSDDLMWWAGNLGDRRPQLRAEFTPKWEDSQLTATFGVGLNGAVNLQDLDSNGYRDGEESSRPALEGRLGFSHTSWTDGQAASVGVSGYYGWFTTSQLVDGRNEFHVQAVNLDFRLPLANRIALQGEGWWGRNLADVRGGIGQGVNPLTGREVRSRGGWSELALQVSSRWSIHPGFSTDDPLDVDIPDGGRTRNTAFYLGNRFRPGGGFLIGMDYLYWITQFKGLSQGIDNRVNVFFQYGF